MPKPEHKDSHQRDHVEWLRPQEQALLGGEIGVYDARFITLLDELQKEGQITSWRRSKDNSPDDSAGRDYWVRVRINEDEVPLSITSTYRLAKYRRLKHPDIPVIYLQKHPNFGEGLRSEKTIKREILDKASSYLKG